jgi:hypothetical protein
MLSRTAAMSEWHCVFCYRWPPRLQAQIVYMRQATADSFCTVKSSGCKAAQ